uniref:Uncharacterized protein n=1 Tax=Meloidogyne incognita TaxID=6306 RepID=A0A914MXI9_MELIC
MELIIEQMPVCGICGEKNYGEVVKLSTCEYCGSGQEIGRVLGHKNLLIKYWECNYVYFLVFNVLE